jgi:hypothetical protein
MSNARMTRGNQYVAGCRMPSNETISMQDRLAREAAEQGSAALLNAVKGYIARHHKPVDKWSRTSFHKTSSGA